MEAAAERDPGSPESGRVAAGDLVEVEVDLAGLDYSSLADHWRKALI
jgi:hypothetical protein